MNQPSGAPGERFMPNLLNFANSPSVVHISAVAEIRDRFGIRQVSSSGSGWIFDVEGHIVTNYHVIKDAKRIQIQLHTGKLRDAQIVGYDRFTDIAVIKIPSGMLHEAVLASPGETVQQGDTVFAFGSPFDFRFSMSSGVVSGMGRYVGVIHDERERWSGYESFIQVDAAINPGNSGGPLTDIRGHVIGMNTAIATGTRNKLDEGQFAGIGLAIPLSMIRPVVEQIIDTGTVTKGYLGIGVDALSKRDIQEYEILGFADGLGVMVTSANPDGPAFAEGVKAGDIITHVNDEVVDTREQLQAVISSMRPGEIARIKLWRYEYETKQGRTITIPVPLVRMDIARVRGFLPNDHPRDSLRIIGIAQMSTSTSKLAASMRVPFSSGVMIEAIVPKSKLDDIATPGCVITRVGDILVRNIDEFFEAIDQFNLRGGVRITIKKPNGKSITERLGPS